MNLGDDFGRPGPREQARRMAIAMAAAHVMGGLVVFVLLGFVMPVPEEVQRDYALTLLNGVVLAAYLAVVVPVVFILGRRMGAPLLDGLARGRLDEPERTLALQFPRRLLALFAAPWAIATLIFFAVNVGRSMLLGSRSRSPSRSAGLRPARSPTCWQNEYSAQSPRSRSPVTCRIGQRSR
jgi:hypothetical protein